MNGVKFCKEMDKRFMKKRYLIIISFLILESFYLLIFKMNDESTKNIIGVYINDEYSSNVPFKDSGYYVEKIECDNGSSGEWDYVNWGLFTTNMSKKSKCNVYFKEDTIVNSIKSQLDTTDKCPSVNADGAVNVTSSESENSLLCSAPDNYGTSYYYRGNVQNNYVYFAGFYWRIVRINGDGSIRIIYDGTVAHKNGEASEDRIIGQSAFNEQADDNAYVGYMYGTPGSSTYEETHANINDSTIKKYVDSWYENNLKGTNFEKYLADNLFCNDRTISNYNPLNFPNFGYGKYNTQYRYSYGPWSAPMSSDNAKMSFKCMTKNDSLFLKIAIINKSEGVLAGGYSGGSYYFLRDGNDSWEMSPDCYNGLDGYLENGAAVRYSCGDGNIACDSNVTKVHGVKPVINLKQGSLKSGNGTITDAYLTD